MSASILRIIILTLIACGISGAILFKLQSPRVPPSLPSPDSFVAHTRPNHSEKLRAIEADIARSMATMPMESRFGPRPAAARPVATTAALSTDSEDEVDLNDPALRLPLARLALTAVGVDEFADQLWLHAINDPAVAADARKDLIEDLNHDGFADPKNPTRDELTLIEARLAMIDRLAPDAMDKTNAEAFAEARKDLLAMRERIGVIVSP